MDILDVAVERLAHDDHNHIPREVLTERLARVRGTRLETRLEEAADVFIEEVRNALTQSGDPTYGEVV